MSGYRKALRKLYQLSKIPIIHPSSFILPPTYSSHIISPTVHSSLPPCCLFTTPVLTSHWPTFRLFIAPVLTPHWPTCWLCTPPVLTSHWPTSWLFTVPVLISYWPTCRFFTAPVLTSHWPTSWLFISPVPTTYWPTCWHFTSRMLTSHWPTCWFFTAVVLTSRWPTSGLFTAPVLTSHWPIPLALRPTLLVSDLPAKIPQIHAGVSLCLFSRQDHIWVIYTKKRPQTICRRPEMLKIKSFWFRYQSTNSPWYIYIYILLRIIVLYPLTFVHDCSSMPKTRFFHICSAYQTKLFCWHAETLRWPAGGHTCNKRIGYCGILTDAEETSLKAADSKGIRNSGFMSVEKVITTNTGFHTLFNLELTCAAMPLPRGELEW